MTIQRPELKHNYFVVDIPEDLVLQVKEAHQFSWGSEPPPFSSVVEGALRRELARLEDIKHVIEEMNTWRIVAHYDEHTAWRRKSKDIPSVLPPVPINMDFVVDRYRCALRHSHPTWTVHKSRTIGEISLLGSYYIEDGSSLVRHHVDLVTEARDLGLLAVNEVVSEPVEASNE